MKKKKIKNSLKQVPKPWVEENCFWNLFVKSKYRYSGQMWEFPFGWKLFSMVLGGKIENNNRIKSQQVRYKPLRRQHIGE